MEFVAVDRLRPDTEQEFACPWFPKSPKSRKSIEDLELRLGQMRLRLIRLGFHIVAIVFDPAWAAYNLPGWNPVHQGDHQLHRKIARRIAIGA